MLVGLTTHMHLRYLVSLVPPSLGTPVVLGYSAEPLLPWLLAEALPPTASPYNSHRRLRISAARSFLLSDIWDGGPRASDP
jgi:hypothetical protein